MSDFNYIFRSNFFRVKNETDFVRLCEATNVAVWKNTDGLFAVYSGGYCPGNLPCYSRDIMDDDDEETENLRSIVAPFLTEAVPFVNFEELLAQHLADGEVAVLMECGMEGYDSSGYAVAIDNTGKRISLQMDDIYKLAKKEFGVEPTRASC